MYGSCRWLDILSNLAPANYFFEAKFTQDTEIPYWLQLASVDFFSAGK